MMDILIGKLDRYRATRLLKRSRYRQALAHMPPSLLPYWKNTAHLEFEGIPRDAFFFASAAEGLMAFFDCVRHSTKPCALPSKAADSVWHAWLRLDEAGLARVCLRHFGRIIAHVEAQHMAAPEEALATCLVKARMLESRPALDTRVPRLFALDYRLNMPGGAAYLDLRGEIAHAPILATGRVDGRWTTPPALSAAGLLAAGLVSETAYEAWLLRAHSADGGGVTVSSECGDGGGDGGSCGGGCGGGD